MTNEVIFYITKNNPPRVKTGKNIFSSVLGGYKMRTLTRKGLIQSSCTDATVCICSTKKVFIKISQISQQNTCGLHVCNFIKNRLQHRCFPVKFAKLLRTRILKNICKRLLHFLRDVVEWNGWNIHDGVFFYQIFMNLENFHFKIIQPYPKYNQAQMCFGNFWQFFSFFSE